MIDLLAWIFSLIGGELLSYKNAEAVLTNARRIWLWKGAASLSQLAQEGTSLPNECKFPCPVDKVTLPNIIEMIEVTQKAKESIDSVPVWSAHART